MTTALRLSHQKTRSVECNKSVIQLLPVRHASPLALPASINARSPQLRSNRGLSLDSLIVKYPDVGRSSTDRARLDLRHDSRRAASAINVAALETERLCVASGDGRPVRSPRMTDLSKELMMMAIKACVGAAGLLVMVAVIANGQMGSLAANSELKAEAIADPE